MRVFEITTSILATTVCSLGLVAFNASGSKVAIASQPASIVEADQIPGATAASARTPLSRTASSEASAVKRSVRQPQFLSISLAKNLPGAASPAWDTPVWDSIVARSLGASPAHPSDLPTEISTETTVAASPQPSASATQTVTTPVNPAAVHVPVLSPGALSVPGRVNASGLDQTYTLGPGDLVRVDFFNVPEFSGEQVILIDGSLNLPVLGRLPVAGMTVAEAEEAIVTQYRPQLRHPQVVVTLLRARPLQVGIVGEVNQPGLYTLSLDENAQFLSIAQIIQAAGGVTQAADMRQVEVRRPRRSGVDQIIAVDLWEFLRNGDISQNLALRDGDTVVIPATTDVNLAETAQLAASNLAANGNQSLDVALVGEVFRPGAYKLGRDQNTNEEVRPTLTQAIQIAGGVTPLADLRQIEVRRPTRAGEEQVIQINLWELLRSGDLSQDLILQQGDTVMIPTATDLTPEQSVQIASANLSPTTIRVNVVGQVENPGSVEVSPNTTMNQGILAAGGFTRQANRSVEFIHLNPNGTIERRTIKVDLSQSVDPETNPILGSNDVVVVRRTTFSSITEGLGDVGNLLGGVLRLVTPF